MTLYIYRVGWTYPARNPIYRSKSMNNPSCTRTPPVPVRPVGPTGQTGRPLPDRPQCLDRSDRSVIPVRPVSANFDCQHVPSSNFQVMWISSTARTCSGFRVHGTRNRLGHPCLFNLSVETYPLESGRLLVN